MRDQPGTVPETAGAEGMTILPIDLDYLAAWLKKLLETPSPTGFTDNIVRECCAELERLGIDYEVTRRGAIRACLRGVTS